MEANQPQGTPQPKKSATARQIEMGLVEIPPQALDVEMAVLGAMLIDKRGVNEVIDTLRPEMFYDTKHQLIYRAILELFESGTAVDLLTVKERLAFMGKLREAGGEFYLVDLSRKVSSAAHIEYHARIIMEKYMRRQMIDVANEMKADAYDETKDVFDIVDKAEQNIYNVSQGTMKQGSEPADTILLRIHKELQELTQEDKLPGVPSGFPSIDRLTSGWQKGDLIILAARPSMGKTAFALNMARHVAFVEEKPAAFFSLEMTSDQLLKRILASETQINASKFRSGNFTEAELSILENKIKEISNHPHLYINDTSFMTIFDLRAQARRLKSKHDIQIIFIDYLQLMHASNQFKPGNREQEISTISRNLKALAKELEIPVVALSQLSRKVEDRYKEGQHKRPQLSDLRESGAIEQDADIVTFLYRPEYYHLTEWDTEPFGPTDNQVEIIFAKHRNGSTGTIRLQFFKNYGLFTEINDFAPGTSQVLDSKLNSMPDSVTPPGAGDAFGLDDINPQDTPDDPPF
ncbi:MAG: replicative DNA helicase [Chlorobi bacterium]|nr:replicative DNA helicase [Chlorobiota bacterium]